VKVNAAVLIQYRNRVGAGPSENTCPRWPSHRAHLTSTRCIKREVSATYVTTSSLLGFVKLGQPVPESNLSSDLKRCSLHAAHKKDPDFLRSNNGPTNGRSVPDSRRTKNCSGVNSLRHSSGLFVMMSPLEGFFRISSATNGSGAQYLSSARVARNYQKRP